MTYMGIVHYLKTRRRTADAAPLVVTPHGFSLGETFVAWQAVSEIRGWKCDRMTTDEAYIGFTVGDACIAVGEEHPGFDVLEAAMTAAFPSTATWRGVVLAPTFARNETVLFRRTG